MIIYAAGSILFLLSTWFLFRRRKQEPTLTDKIVNERITYEQNKHFLLKQIDKSKTARQYQLALDQAYEHGKREAQDSRELADLRQSYKILSDYYSDLSLHHSQLQEEISLAEQYEDAYHNVFDRVERILKELDAEKSAHTVTREKLATYVALAQRLERERDEAKAFPFYDNPRAKTVWNKAFNYKSSKPVSFAMGEVVSGTLKLRDEEITARWELTQEGWQSDWRTVPYEEVLGFDARSV
jgi:ribosomal protein S17E